MNIKITVCVILLLNLISCKGIKNTISDEEIYNFINVVLTDLSSDYKKCDAISDKTLTTIDGNHIPIPGVKYDSSKTIKHLADYGYIDSSDVNFILQQQCDSTFRLDQDKINKRLLKHVQIDSIFNLENDLGYEVLRDSLGIKCYGYISKPLFSKDRNTVLISFEWFKGYLYGQGSILIFKKRIGVWKLEQVIGTWES
ncbi:hypothetical protein ACE1ET_20340 [Saccharicrinis sp. FJH62]